MAKVEETGETKVANIDNTTVKDSDRINVEDNDTIVEATEKDREHEKNMEKDKKREKNSVNHTDKSGHDEKKENMYDIDSVQVDQNSKSDLHYSVQVDQNSETDPRHSENMDSYVKETDQSPEMNMETSNKIRNVLTRQMPLDDEEKEDDVLVTIATSADEVGGDDDGEGGEEAKTLETCVKEKESNLVSKLDTKTSEIVGKSNQNNSNSLTVKLEVENVEDISQKKPMLDPSMSEEMIDGKTAGAENDSDQKHGIFSSGEEERNRETAGADNYRGQKQRSSSLSEVERKGETTGAKDFSDRRQGSIEKLRAWASSMTQQSDKIVVVPASAFYRPEHKSWTADDSETIVVPRDRQNVVDDMEPKAGPSSLVEAEDHMDEMISHGFSLGGSDDGSTVSSLPPSPVDIGKEDHLTPVSPLSVSGSSHSQAISPLPFSDGEEDLEDPISPLPPTPERNSARSTTTTPVVENTQRRHSTQSENEPETDQVQGHEEITDSGQGQSREVLDCGQGHNKIRDSQGHKEVTDSSQCHKDVTDSSQGHKDITGSGQGHKDIINRGQGHKDIIDSNQGYKDVIDRGQGHKDMIDSGHGHKNAIESDQGHQDVIGSGQGQSDQGDDQRQRTKLKRTKTRHEGHEKVRENRQGHEDLIQNDQDQSDKGNDKVQKKGEGTIPDKAQKSRKRCLVPMVLPVDESQFKRRSRLSDPKTVTGTQGKTAANTNIELSSQGSSHESKNKNATAKQPEHKVTSGDKVVGKTPTRLTVDVRHNKTTSDSAISAKCSEPISSKNSISRVIGSNVRTIQCKAHETSSITAQQSRAHKILQRVQKQRVATKLFSNSSQISTSLHDSISKSKEIMQRRKALLTAKSSSTLAVIQPAVQDLANQKCDKTVRGKIANQKSVCRSHTRSANPRPVESCKTESSNNMDISSVPAYPGKRKRGRSNTSEGQAQTAHHQVFNFSQIVKFKMYLSFFLSFNLVMPTTLS